MVKKSAILVIEDNEFNMAMAKDLLNLAGFETIEAEDADSGLQLAKTRLPDLILMDMHLPLLDGYQATQNLKAMPDTAGIPVVAFTALAMEDEQKKAFQSGCSGLISKPINVDTFAQSVAAYLPGELNTETSMNRACSQPDVVDPVPPARESLAQQAAYTTEMNVSHQDREQDLEEFLYRISHDLQSPLRKIRQFGKFLKEGAKDELSAENYQMLESLNRSANQMHDLLSDLLQLARISRTENNLSTFKLIQAVQDAMQMHQSTITALDAQFELEKLDPMLSIEGNYGQWVQLFCQLIQNSLKYQSHQIRPRIQIETHPHSEHPGWLTLSVQDNGIGLRQEYADKIFQPLHRLHGVSKYGGTGVGLAIVKKIVDAHHGLIHVHSEPEQGANFMIDVPLTQGNAIPSVACQV